MKEMTAYNIELKSILDKNLNELEEDLKDINEEIINDFLINYLKNDYDYLYENIQISQKAIQILMKKLKSNDDKCAFQLGMTSGITRVYKQLLNNEIADLQFRKKINALLAHKDTEKILIKLYNHNDIQNKVLIEAFGTYTNKLLNELVDINCIYKTKIGKFVLYNLTKIGRQFVKDHLDNNEVVNCYKININKNIQISRNKFYNLKYNNYLDYEQEKEKCLTLMKY